MTEQIIAIFCVCDDLLVNLGHREDQQVKMTDSEVMTTAIVAVLFYAGNFEKARCMLKSFNFIPQMLSRSRFNRRLHRIKELFLSFFFVIGELWKSLNENTIYLMDSFPIPICDNYRIPKSKIYKQEKFRGYISSKKRYFYGIRIHLIVTEKGEPVEFFFAPGSFSDVDSLKVFHFNLPKGSKIFADKAYNDYEIEDLLKET